MDHWFAGVVAWLSLPQYGLLTLFVVSLVSATLLPLGSEPALAPSRGGVDATRCRRRARSVRCGISRARWAVARSG